MRHASKAPTHGKPRYYEEVELGDEIGPLEKEIGEEAVAAFCRVWGSPTPNRFTDAETAKEAGLPWTIVPGSMSTAIMAQLLADWAPNGVLKRVDVVFRQPVPHRRVIVAAVVTNKRREREENLIECDVYMSNQESGRLIGGNAVISLPSLEP